MGGPRVEAAFRAGAACRAWGGLPGLAGVALQPGPRRQMGTGLVSSAVRSTAGVASKPVQDACARAHRRARALAHADGRAHTQPHAQTDARADTRTQTGARTGFPRLAAASPPASWGRRGP